MVVLPGIRPSFTTTAKWVGSLVMIIWVVWSRHLEWKQYNTSATTEYPQLSQFEHYLVHTPKSAGSFAFDMLLYLLHSTPQYKHLSPEDRRTICDGRTNPTSEFETKYPYRLKGVICNFWMAERPFTADAKHNYIVVRHPRAHILSQYFHCKESIDHYDRWKYMPSLTQWLEAWVAAIGNATQAKLNQQFKCYDPRNLQSRFAGIGETRNVTVLSRILETKFSFVGDNERMWPSICGIFMNWTGWIPHECDCTGTQDPDHRELKFHLYGHGVRHHGSSYVTTAYQDELLAQLMTQDAPLYEAAQQVFDQQRRAMEQDYRIEICSKRK